MSINDLPVLSALRTKMQWHQERQRVLSEPVPRGNAHSHLPDHAPRDPHTANRARDQPYFLIPRGDAAAPLINRPRIAGSKTTSERPKLRWRLLVNAVFVAKMRWFCRCWRVLAAPMQTLPSR